MDPIATSIVAECRRLSESCLYTSTSLFIWLRWLRWVRVGFITVSALCGGLAGWSILKVAPEPGYRTLGAVAALLAGVLPAIYGALRADDGLAKCAMLAGEFKNLQDRFLQAATIGSSRPPEEFQKLFERLMGRLERARAHSYTAPEWCFKKAQHKVKSGHYDPDTKTGPS